MRKVPSPETVDLMRAIDGVNGPVTLETACREAGVHTSTARSRLRALGLEVRHVIRLFVINSDTYAADDPQFAPFLRPHEEQA